jgi:hypothetical protein
MKLPPFALASALAMILAFGLALRIFSQSYGFRHTVNQSLANTEGYDQKFIDLVDHIEDVLTTRASFAYPGGRDPMTGRRREVAMPVVQETNKRVSASKSKSSKANPEKRPAPKPDSAKTPEPPIDKVKLTAIIADDYGQHTAIVMDGERSMSVDVGDMVGSRKVTKITSKEVTMEDAAATYSYDISGNRNYQPK